MPIKRPTLNKHASRRLEKILVCIFPSWMRCCWRAESVCAGSAVATPSAPVLCLSVLWSVFVLERRSANSIVYTPRSLHQEINATGNECVVCVLSPPPRHIIVHRALNLSYRFGRVMRESRMVGAVKEVVRGLDHFGIYFGQATRSQLRTK